ncbi:Zinc finger CCCH domain-containing protein 10 [Taenia crassiceps]|uniref:Zinc finger CCCH domain-containing protein 10 n=1 Tax=Taenia crassiceps TaxID=6207 RepID=A0ABR4QTD3_9CEST
MQADEMLSDASVRCKNYADADSDVCRDFLRNVCKRGKKCKYRHPVSASPLDASLEPIYCHDFQNGVCRRYSCKFLHYTKKEEGFFRSHGVTPPPQSSDCEVHDIDAPICKDFLNHNCHRGSSCKFRHGKPVSSPNTSSSFNSISNKSPTYHNSDLPHHTNLPNHLSHQCLQYQNGNGNAVSPPRTSESAVTTSETTAMVAAAAAAGYLAMQKHGQHHQHQYHRHGTAVQGSSPMTSLSTSALPPASAAAVAAAAAATALATTQHHQQHHASYSETVLTASQSTGIPVMQSILGVVTNSDVLRPRGSNDSTFSSTTPLPSTSVPTDVGCHYHQGNDGPMCGLKSNFCVSRDYQVSPSVDFDLPSLANHSAKSASYVNSDVIKKPVNSHTPFNQHSQQQQDANTAAAVAAAACFGAILSQPVAAAAAASHAAVSKPTASDILSQAVGGDCALSSMSAPPTVIVPQPSASGVTSSAPPAPPPPTAVAAAAAAAVAAAVVSSAGPSAAVAAISAAHLATSSLSHAHSATRVSCAPPDTSLALTASASPYATNMKPSGAVDPLGVGGRHRKVCNSNETRVDVYGTDDNMPLRLNVPPSPPPPPSAIPAISAATAANPSPLGSSAATAAYTATMTTAAAAAAMAAAVAVEEHNQKKNAAAAAMAAFSESAALAHEVQNMARIADHTSLSPGSLPSSSLTTTTKSSPSEITTVYPLPTGKPVHRRRLRLPRNRHQAHFPAFDVVDDESYEESYDEDEEDEGDETSSTVLDPHHKYRKCSRIESDASKEEPIKRPACISHLSPQASSINSATEPPRMYRECGLPTKRPKLVAPCGDDHVASSNSPTYMRRGYQHFSRRVQQIDMESEMDEEEELCYTEDAEFYSPAAVVTQPSYRERLHVLKCENARLRLHLQRVVQQRNQLQIENHTLIKQNLKLRNLSSATKRSSIYSKDISVKSTPTSFLAPEAKQRLLRSPSPSPRPTPSVSNRKKPMSRNPFVPAK